MMYHRPANERGATKLDWLDSRHTFSFGDYYDSAHMGFGTLRVINEDRIAPGGGFPPHGHRDMEIISVVLAGALAHEDSMGNRYTIQAGEVQRMSAGRGIVHSEYNASQTDPVDFLQIWIEPRFRGIEPGYEQKLFDNEGVEGRLRPIVSHDGREGSLAMNQDATVYDTILSSGEGLIHRSSSKRIWLQVTAGELTANEVALAAGDGLGLTDESELRLESEDRARALIFEL